MKSLKKKDIMVFIILSATVALAYQLPYMKYTFYDQVKESLQLTDTQLGFLGSCLTFTNTLCYPIGGIFADKFSMKKLICITLAAFAILTFLLGFVTYYPVLIVIHVLYGFFGIATLWSAYLKGLRGLGDEKASSSIFGSSESTRGILQTITSFTFLGLMSIAATPVLGYRYIMTAGAGFTLVVLILAIIFLPSDKKQPKTDEKVEEKAKSQFSVGDVLKNPGVWLTIWVIMCAYVSWTIGNNYMTTYTTRVVGISAAQASTIGVFRSYVIVLCAGFIGGWMLDRFTYKGKGFMVFLSLTAIFVALVICTNKSVPLCVAMTLIVALFANVMKSTYWSIMGQAGIPLEMTGLATGIISFIAFIPDFIIPTVCGIWLDQAEQAGNVAAGFNKIFFLVIGFSVAGILGAFLLMKRTKSLEKNAEV